MVPSTTDPLDAYRRARFWFLIFIVLNVVTSLELQELTLIWWPMLIAFFHLGRAEASS